MDYLKIETSRDAYSVKDVMRNAMTAGELMEILSEYEEETPIILSFDNGYTYGNIGRWDITDEYLEEQ